MLWTVFMLNPRFLFALTEALTPLMSWDATLHHFPNVQMQTPISASTICFDYRGLMVSLCALCWPLEFLESAWACLSGSFVLTGQNSEPIRWSKKKKKVHSTSYTLMLLCSSYCSSLVPPGSAVCFHSSVQFFVDSAKQKSFFLTKYVYNGCIRISQFFVQKQEISGWRGVQISHHNGLIWLLPNLSGLEGGYWSQ